MVRRAVVRRAVERFAVLRRAVVRFAVVRRAVVRFAGLRRAVARFAVLRRALELRVAARFFEDFLRAGGICLLRLWVDDSAAVFISYVGLQRK